MKTFAKKWMTWMVALAVVLGGIALVGTVAPGTARAKTRAQATQTAKKKKAIGKQKAIKIALKDARLKKSQVKRLKCRVDRERGHKVYEVEFRRGKYEYEYDIDCYTGKIRDKDKEIDRD